MPLAEGQVGESGLDGVAYSEVTSCLTVTCFLEDGRHVGGHLSLYPTPGGNNSTQVLPAMTVQIAGRAVLRVHLKGELGYWSTEYLDTTPEALGRNGAESSDPQLRDAVVAHLGLGDVERTSEQGELAFTVSLAEHLDRPTWEPILQGTADEGFAVYREVTTWAEQNSREDESFSVRNSCYTIANSMNPLMETPNDEVPQLRDDMVQAVQRLAADSLALALPPALLARMNAFCDRATGDLDQFRDYAVTHIIP